MKAKVIFDKDELQFLVELARNLAKKDSNLPEEKYRLELAVFAELFKRKLNVFVLNEKPKRTMTLYASEVISLWRILRVLNLEASSDYVQIVRNGLLDKLNRHLNEL